MSTTSAEANQQGKADGGTSGTPRERPGITRPKTISMDRDILERAEARAQAQVRSFSNYIETLVRADLDQGDLFDS